MRKFFILISILLQACSTTEQEIQTAESNVCDIAYTRYQATVTGLCQEPKAQLLAEIPIQERKIEIRPIEEIPEVFWYAQKMSYTLVKQDGPAPLAFIIAGTGAAYNSPKNVILQKTLYAQGYHVIGLSSPTFANYIINSNNDQMIGDLTKDAVSLYKTMQIILKDVQEKEDVQATSFSLTGYSLGGAHAAFVAKLDETEQQFNFKKVLMINPPVSLFNSVRILDSYIDIKNNRQAIIAMFDRILERTAVVYSDQESSKFTDDSIYELFKGIDMTDDELKLLIGSSFRMSSSDMLYAIDSIYNVGALKYKNHQVSKFESLTDSMHRADTLTFENYFDKGMLPWTQAIEPGITREELIARLSLRSIEDYLKQADKITVVHNADDIILAEGEIEYIKQVFGERAKIFERGGHMGNIDRVDFINHVSGQFSGAAL